MSRVTMATVYGLMKKYQDGEITQAQLASDVAAAVDEGLQIAGAAGLNDINDVGMIAALFYLYGLGIIPDTTIRTFLSNEERLTMDRFAIKIQPSDKVDAPLRLEVAFLKKRDVSNMSD